MASLLRLARVVSRARLARPSGAAAASLAHAPAPRRSLGLMDKVAGFVEKKKGETEEDTFATQRDLLLKYDKFSFASYREVFRKIADDSGVFGWKSKIPGRGAEQKKVMEQVRKELGILEHFGPEDGGVLGQEARLRIAAAAGVTEDEVREISVNYLQMRVYHKWMKRRIQRGQALPSTQKETQQMMARDPPKMSKKEMAVLGGGQRQRRI